MDDLSALTDSHPLVDAIKRGNAALFLGAGASRGAKHPKSRAIPTGREFANLLAKEFLSDRYIGGDFRTVYDFACSRAGVRKVQAFVKDTLEPYDPADFHLLVPEFSWKAIFTTNYDRIIEKAYRESQSAVQEPTVLTQDKAGSLDRLSPSEMPFIKLHGCINEYESVDPPLVASTEQIIHYQNKRRGLFGFFLEIAKNYYVAYVGYAFGDHNIRAITDEVIQDGDNHPPHFIIKPDIDDIESAYWHDRRIRPIQASFAEFLGRLDALVPPTARSLSRLSIATRKTAFTRFVTTNALTESEALQRYLETEIAVLPAIGTGNPDPSLFYKGFSSNWSFVESELDVPRPETETLLREEVLIVKSRNLPRFVVVKSYAGGGRTVLMKRTADRAARIAEFPTIFVGDNGYIDLERFREIFSLTNLPVSLFVDDLSSHVDNVEILFTEAKRNKWPLLVIGSERYSDWNTICEDRLGIFIDQEYSIRNLNSGAIDALVRKLERYDCLGVLRDFTHDQRVKKFEEVYERQILVALHEATSGSGFTDIILNEYENITPRRAQQLYLDVCSLHRFGAPARAGLISRVHGLQFEDFQREFLRPLEEVVIVEQDSTINDYVYKSRHSYIADIVYRSKVVSLDDKFENLTRIVTKLNPNFSYDVSVVGKLMRSNNLIDVGFPRRLGWQLYETALNNFGANDFLYHQLAIFLMHTANTYDQLDDADSILEKAIELNQSSTAIRHTKAEIALKRSRLAANFDEAHAWRSRAVELATPLTRRSRSAHPFHTIAKARVDSLEHVVGDFEKNPRAPGVERLLEQDIKDAEEALRLGLDAFPGDPHILTAQAKYFELLSHADRALQALEKAFRGNPRSTLVAMRLANLYTARKDYPASNKVILECLDHNVGNHDLHFMLAMNLISEDDYYGNSNRRAVIRNHLQRSFQRGDRKYNRRLLFGRELFIAEQTEARAIFDELKSAGVAYELKRKTSWPLLDQDQSRARFAGVIEKTLSTHCFIRTNNFASRVYYEIPSDSGAAPLEGDAVTFAIGFTMFGPIALDLAS